MSAKIAWPRGGMPSVALAGALVGAAIAFIAMIAWPWTQAQSAHLQVEGAKSSNETAPDAINDQVTLPPAIQAESDIRIEECRFGQVEQIVEVAGSIEADHDLYVPIRSRTIGVTRQVLVTIGQKMKKGQVLAYLDSAEVAATRIELANRRRESDVAQADADWKATVAANVEELVQAIRQNTPVTQVGRRFVSKPLGQQRAALMSAYAEFEAASIEERKQGELAQQQIVGQPKATMATRQRITAQASLESVLEQVRYDARRQKILADQAVQKADSHVADTLKKLEILGASDAEQSADDLALVPIVAPFDGIVLDRPIAPGQRVTPDDILFPFADTSQIHVVAHVPESEIQLLPTVDQRISFTAASYPNEVFTAHVHAVGADIDPKTRTTPLLADAPNADGRLKLGSFVKIRLTKPMSESVLSVPASSVVEIDGQTGVFTSSVDETSFTFRSVQAGPVAGDRRVILKGLKTGDRVAAGDTTLLKHELILSNEPEEE